MNFTNQLIQLITKINFTNIPPEVIRVAKRMIMDCLGVTILGSSEQCSKIALEYLQEFNDRGNARIITYKLGTSAPSAAFVNGIMAHALDYDDSNLSMEGHPSAPVLPVIIALGSELRSSGKDILEAFILGIEMETKMGRAVNPIHYEMGWHPTAILGTLGATVAAGKLLQLNPDQFQMALGIAVSEAAGVKGNFGTMTKPLHVGNAARNGIIAAILARRGFTANVGIFEINFGGFGLFCGGKSYELNKIIDKFSNPYDLVSPGVSFKKYPCCGSTHSCIDAILSLRNEYQISGQDVMEIKCGVHHRRIPHTNRPDPKTGLEAKFSNQYVTATALQDGRIKLNHFEDANVSNVQIRELMKKIVLYGDSEVESWEGEKGEFGAIVRIKLGNNVEYCQKIKFPRGFPENPMSDNELEEKYRHCVESVMSRDAVDRSLLLLRDIETLSDIRKLIDLTCDTE